MKKLLVLLSLFGCASAPIEYSLKPTYGGYGYEVFVSSANPADDITLVRNHAFAIADNTCKSFGKSWAIDTISEVNASNGKRVHLVFTCPAPRD